jgi:hypothetical protein
VRFWLSPKRSRGGLCDNGRWRRGRRDCSGDRRRHRHGFHWRRRRRKDAGESLPARRTRWRRRWTRRLHRTTRRRRRHRWPLPLGWRRRASRARGRRGAMGLTFRFFLSPRRVVRGHFGAETNTAIRDAPASARANPERHAARSGRPAEKITVCALHAGSPGGPAIRTPSAKRNRLRPASRLSTLRASSRRRCRCRKRDRRC